MGCFGILPGVAWVKFFELVKISHWNVITWGFIIRGGCSFCKLQGLPICSPRSFRQLGFVCLPTGKEVVRGVILFKMTLNTILFLDCGAWIGLRPHQKCEGIFFVGNGTHENLPQKTQSPSPGEGQSLDCNSFGHRSNGVIRRWWWGCLILDACEIRIQGLLQGTPPPPAAITQTNPLTLPLIVEARQHPLF